MARGAVERGYDYVAITDHTKGLPIANGNDEATVRTQWVEMRAAARELPARFRILRAVEMNLSPDGTGEAAALGTRTHGCGADMRTANC